MAYATQANITDLYGTDFLNRIADLDVTPGSDVAVVTSALTRAESRVNSYMASRFTLPFSWSPPELLQPTVDIAVYFMANDAARMTEEIRERYKDAIAYLKDVAAGRATIAPNPGEEEEDPAETPDALGSIGFAFFHRT